MPDIKEEKKEVTHELTQNNEFIFKGTEFECYYKLQRVQGQSANWAMTYEGYKISRLSD